MTFVDNNRILPTRDDDWLSGSPNRQLDAVKELTRRLDEDYETTVNAIHGHSEIFTPTIGNGSSDISSFTADPTGNMVVIGQMAFFTINAAFGSGHGLTGNLQIAGLPFAADDSSIRNHRWVVHVLSTAGTVFSGTGIIDPSTSANSKTISEVYDETGTQQTLNTAAYTLTITGFYRIATNQ